MYALLLFLGYQELLIILLIVLVLFGATRVPQLMRGLGLGVKEFREGMKEDSKPDEPADGDKAGADEDSGKQ